MSGTWLKALICIVSSSQPPCEAQVLLLPPCWQWYDKYQVMAPDSGSRQPNLKAHACDCIALLLSYIFVGDKDVSGLLLFVRIWIISKYFIARIQLQKRCRVYVHVFDISPSRRAAGSCGSAVWTAQDALPRLCSAPAASAAGWPETGESSAVSAARSMRELQNARQHVHDFRRGVCRAFWRYKLCSDTLISECQSTSTWHSEYWKISAEKQNSEVCK